MKTTSPRLISAAFLLLAPLASVRAGDYTWNLSTGGTWDSTTANWSGTGSTWGNSSGNNASFGPFGAGATIALGENITVGTLSTNGGATVLFNTGAGTTIDATQITTAGASGSSGSIDMFKVLTGSHDLTYHSTGTSGNQGRLNLKSASTYTGNTFLTGTAYLLSDNVSNALPTGTTLNMTANTTFRINKANTTQEIAGLAGAGTFQVSSTGNTVTINTKSAATTSYAGSLTGSTNLVIQGSGIQALTGGSVSFTGSTTVSGGTLRLGNNLSGTTSVLVNGGVLDSTVANVNLGTGAVTLSSGEISARGNAAAGTFTLAANQNFSSTGGKLTFNIGTASDQIKGSGTGTFGIGSGTELALILGTGFSYASTYQLFDSFSGGSVAGTGVTITGYDTTNWTAALSNGGILSFTASSIPEPSTYAALAGVTMLGFAALRRRRCPRA